MERFLRRNYLAKNETEQNRKQQNATKIRVSHIKEVKRLIPELVYLTPVKCRTRLWSLDDLRKRA